MFVLVTRIVKMTRKRWSNEEKGTALRLFGKNIRSRNLPSGKDIADAIMKNPVLKGRTPPQIKPGYTTKPEQTQNNNFKWNRFSRFLTYIEIEIVFVNLV